MPQEVMRCAPRVCRPAGRLALAIAALCTLLAAPVTLYAQVDTGSVGGTISDETDAVLPGVSVTVRNLSTGQVRSVVTGGPGRYQIAGLPPGRYSVTAELPGFTTVVRPEVTVNVGSAVDVNITMTLAGVAETVTVSGEAPIVESAKTSVSYVITQTQLEALPSKGRQYLDFVLLLPASVENTSTTGQGTLMNIGGARSFEAALLVDGFYNQDEGFAKIKQQHSQDAIQEFQVITFGGSAEYGRAIGGIVNAVTRSGGNTFRGTAYGFFRDTSLNAQDAASKQRGDPKPEIKRQQFGGVFSGPIQQNKSFFFGAYERVNETQPYNNGIKPEHGAIIGLPTDDIGSIRWFQKVHFAMGKWDHNFSENTRLQASGSMTRFHSLSPLRAFETRSRGWGINPTDYQYLVKWTRVSGDGKVFHELKGSYSPRFYFTSGPNEGGPPLTPEGQINVGVATNASPPSVGISSVASFGRSTLNIKADTHPGQVIYSSSIFTDRHTIKFGADYMATYFDYNLPSQLMGSYSFGSLDRFLAGNYTSFSQGFGDPHNPRWHRHMSGFIQDSWQVNPRLTMNYGARYDLEIHPQHKASGQRFGEDYNNGAPRFAVSYDLTDKGTTFVKLATGIYYDRVMQNLTTFFTSLKGFQQVESATWRPTDPGAPTYPNVFTQRPADLPRSVINAWVMPDEFRTPTSGQIVGTIEHAVGSGLALSGTVVYTRSWDKPYGWDTNLVWDDAGGKWVRPDPDYRQLSQYRFDGRAEYVGGILEASMRGARAGLNGNLTLARAYDTGNSYGSRPEDQRIGIEGEWAPTVDTPTVRGVISAWCNLSQNTQLAGIFRARTGMALSASASGYDLNGDGTFGDRTPSFGRNAFRQPGNSSLDLRFSWRVPLVENRAFSIYVEAYNVLDQENVRTSNGDYGPDPANPISRWMEPITFFSPREVQLGARLTF